MFLPGQREEVETSHLFGSAAPLPAYWSIEECWFCVRRRKEQASRVTNLKPGALHSLESQKTFRPSRDSRRMRELFLIALPCASLAASDAPCKACLATEGNAWCYSSHSCQTISLELFKTCPDFSFNPDTCLCRPDTFTNCQDCASLDHLGCIWMANASVTQNVTFKFGPVQPQSIVQDSYWKQGRCVQGSGFSPFGLEIDESLDIYGIQVNYTQVVRPTDWYWAQCSISGPAMAGSMLGGIPLVSLLCCLGCHCCKKRRRNRLLLINHTGAKEPLVAVAQ